MGSQVKKVRIEKKAQHQPSQGAGSGFRHTGAFGNPRRDFKNVRADTPLSL